MNMLAPWVVQMGGAFAVAARLRMASSAPRFYGRNVPPQA
jgi:hypothetical protein